MKNKMEEIKEEIKRMLTEGRYLHSLGAMKAAGELAKIYGDDEEGAKLAGLVHDIAKELPKEEIEVALKKYNIEPDIIERNQLGLLHAKLGAELAREKFNICEKIQNAIKYHTTGNIKMDKFAKIIYLADKIEETRNYPEVEELRRLAKQDLDKAMLFVMNFTIQKSIKKQTLIHPDTIEMRNTLILG
ncbi:MAG: HD domain-containing protein [Clostridia bacterium]|nr:HD domain-containing protein [Clostridia bacterium]